MSHLLFLLSSCQCQFNLTSQRHIKSYLTNVAYARHASRKAMCGSSHALCKLLAYYLFTAVASVSTSTTVFSVHRRQKGPTTTDHTGKIPTSNTKHGIASRQEPWKELSGLYSQKAFPADVSGREPQQEMVPLLTV